MVYCNYTSRYFSPGSLVAIQHILPDWVYVQGSSVVKRRQHEYDAEKKHQKPQSSLPQYLCTVLL